MSVSSTTIRHAIKHLAAEGVVTSRRGSGNYISEDIVQGRRTVALGWGHRAAFAPQSPWHPRVYQKMRSSLEGLGWFTHTYPLFHVSEELDDKVMSQLEADALSRKFTGFISFPEFRFLKPGFQELLEGLGIRYLNFDILSPTNAVVTDYHALGTMGAKYLYEQGVRKMGLIGMSFDTTGGLGADYQGFVGVRHEHPDIVISDSWVRLANASISLGREGFKQIWSAPERPEGLLVSDEVAFIGVVMGMMELGVRYPEDLKLVVQGSTKAENPCVYSPPRLTFCPEQVGTNTVDSLLRMIREEVQTVPTVRFSPAFVPEEAAEVREREELMSVNC